MGDYISNYTGEQIDNILENAVELPDYDNTSIDLEDGNDIGKVLTVGERELEWKYPINTYGAGNGDCLKYSNDSGLIWGNPINFSGAYEGNYLKYSAGSQHLV